MLYNMQRWPFLHIQTMTIKFQIILTLVYLAGFFLSYNMLRIDHAAEKKVYKRGDRVINYCLSVLSFVSVLFILIITWVYQVKKTGYWDQPVRETKAIEEPKPNTK